MPFFLVVHADLFSGAIGQPVAFTYDDSGVEVLDVMVRPDFFYTFDLDTNIRCAVERVSVRIRAV